MKLRQDFRKANVALLREINLSVIINYLQKYGAASRADLSKATDLTKATVSSLVGELLERGFVKESELVAGHAGRPSTPIEINPEAGSIISGELGVDFISVICTDFASKIFWKRRVPIDKTMGQQAIIDRLLAIFYEAEDASNERHTRPLGLALGVPGLVEPETGLLMLAPNLGWERVPIRAILLESFPEPVSVYNESYLGALGEYYLGAGQGHSEVLYIAADIGLGGTLIYNGNPFGGAVAFPGRFGHMTMDPDGEVCPCGNQGCWETQVSRKAIFQLIREAVSQGQPTDLVATTKNGLESLTIETVVEAAHSSDKVALHALTRVGRYLGIGIASLVNALNPELVVLGNILSLAGDVMLPIVHQELQERVLCWEESKTEVVLAQHGFDACLMGGVAMVRQAILPEPEAVLRRPANSRL